MPNPLRSVLLVLAVASALVAQSTGTRSPDTPAPAPAAWNAKLGVARAVSFDLALPAADELPSAFTVDVPVRDERLSLRLRAHSVRATDGFRVVAADGPTERTVPTPAPRTYRGHVVDRPDWAVAASLEPTGLYLTVLPETGRAWIVQPARSVDPNAPRARHVGFDDPGMPVDACGLVGGGSAPRTPAGPRSASAVTDIDVCEIAFDCDHDLYQFQGASVPATVAAVERTMDAVNLMYEREVTLTHRVTHILVRTSEPDPYSGNDAGQLLNPQFRDEWRTNQAGVRRDVAHFLTSRAMGNILGLAYVGVVCSFDWGYGLSQLRGNHGTNASVLGHELGHNWNCPHCLDTCDIMCGCGINGGFGPNDRAQIAAHRASRDCLDPDYPGLVAHWPLDEITGTTAADASGNGIDGIFTGGTLGVPGAANGTGTAVDFDGLGDHVRVPFQAPLGTAQDAFTIALWLAPSRITSVWQRVVGNGTFEVGIYGDRLGLTLGGRRSYASNVRVAVGRFTHAVMTFVPDRGFELYVDGAFGYVNATPAVPRSSTADWHLGAGAGAGEPFAGTIDDVQVYRGAMNAGEAAWLHAHPGETLCLPGWSNYGSGLAGTLRTPSLGVTGRLRTGQTFTLDIESSSGAFIGNGAVVLGFAPASTPLLGGTLLVDLSGAIAYGQLIGPAVTSIPVPLPNDPSLTCQHLYGQFLQIDPGAVRGVAMTPGVEIVIGN